MLRTVLFSALAAMTTLIGPAAVRAADLSDEEYRQLQSAPRHVTRDYDEDDYSARRGYRRTPDWDLRRIEGRGSYGSDHVPYAVKEWRAKQQAIDAWRSKAASLYGERFSHWRAARDKRVTCDAGAGSVYCSASAFPAMGWKRWSWRDDMRRQ